MWGYCFGNRRGVNKGSEVALTSEIGIHLQRQIVLGCGNFVRGRKRKKGDSIPFILSRRDYMSRIHDECPQRASTTSDKLSSIPIIYIPNPSST